MIVSAASVNIYDADNSAVTIVNKGNIHIMKHLRLTTRLTSTGNITISEQATLTLDANSVTTGRVLAEGSLTLGNGVSEHVFNPASVLIIKDTLSCNSNVNISSHLCSVKKIDLLNDNCRLNILPTANFTGEVDDIISRSESVLITDLSERLLINRFTTHYNPTVKFGSPVTIKRYDKILL